MTDLSSPLDVMPISDLQNKTAKELHYWQRKFLFFLSSGFGKLDIYVCIYAVLPTLRIKVFYKNDGNTDYMATIYKMTYLHVTQKLEVQDLKKQTKNVKVILCWVWALEKYPCLVIDLNYRKVLIYDQLQTHFGLSTNSSHEPHTFHQTFNKIKGKKDSSTL